MSRHVGAFCGPHLVVRSTGRGSKQTKTGSRPGGQWPAIRSVVRKRLIDMGLPQALGAADVAGRTWGDRPAYRVQDVCSQWLIAGSGPIGVSGRPWADRSSSRLSNRTYRENNGTPPTPGGHGHDRPHIRELLRTVGSAVAPAVRRPSSGSRPQPTLLAPPYSVVSVACALVSRPLVAGRGSPRRAQWGSGSQECWSCRSRVCR